MGIILGGAVGGAAVGSTAGAILVGCGRMDYVLEGGILGTLVGTTAGAAAEKQRLRKSEEIKVTIKMDPDDWTDPAKYQAHW